MTFCWLRNDYMKQYHTLVVATLSWVISGLLCHQIQHLDSLPPPDQWNSAVHIFIAEYYSMHAVAIYRFHVHGPLESLSSLVVCDLDQAHSITDKDLVSNVQSAVPVSSPTLQDPGDDNSSTERRISASSNSNLDRAVLKKTALIITCHTLVIRTIYLRNCVEGNLSSLQDSIIKLHVFVYTDSCYAAVECVVNTSILLGWTVSPMLLELLLLRFLWTLITSTLQSYN